MGVANVVNLVSTPKGNNEFYNLYKKQQDTINSYGSIWDYKIINKDGKIDIIVHYKKPIEHIEVKINIDYSL